MTKARLISFSSLLILVSLSCQVLSVGQDDVTVVNTEVVSTTLSVEPSEFTETPLAPKTSPPPLETSPTLPPPSETNQSPQGILPTLPPAQPGPDTLDLAQLSGDHRLSDFTENITVNMTWTDSDGAEQNATSLFSHRQQSVPTSSWATLYDDQNIFFPTTVETVLVDGQAYSYSSDNQICNTISTNLVNLDEQRQSFRDLIGALTGQVDKDEADLDLDELRVDVYSLKADNLTPGAEVELEGKYINSDGGSSSTSTTMVLNEEGVVLESGRLFLAQQGGFVARIELLYTKIAGEEDSLFAQPGTQMERMMVYEVLPATGLGEVITPPEGCESTTGGGGTEGGDTDSNDELTISDIPRIGEPTDVVETGENLVYFTRSSVADVVDFYKSELFALGWELEEEVSLGAVATLEFVLGNQTINISIVETDGEVMVTAEIY